MALQFEARKVALKQDRTGYVLTLCIHPDEIPYELLKDFVGARYGCALVRIADDESAVQYTNRVQTAGMLCKREEFWEFLGAVDEHTAAQILCSHLSIESRSELNGNKRAQERFDELIKRYEANDEPF